MPTTIEWTQRPGTKGETWNPTTGCNKVSQGCKHCYAETMHKRLRAMHQPKYQHHFLDGVRTHPDTLTIPLQWKKPRTVFVNSMSDLFHADVPFEFIDQVFAIMALTPQHTYQILTKRPERMAEYFHLRTSPRSAGSEAAGPAHPGSPQGAFAVIMPSKVKPFGEQYAEPGEVPVTMCKHPLPNVWLGTSCEDQATANERIPHLLRVPAAVRFLSCEPLLGLVRLGNWLQRCPNSKHVDGRSHGLRWDGDDPYTICDWCGETRSAPSGMVVGTSRTITDIHWVITGGESGPKARPMHPSWARSLRDQCAAAGVPFFFKQWGQLLPECQAGHLLPDDTVNIVGVPSPHNADRVNKYLSVGKHASGNLLDGRTHTEYPATVSTMSTRNAVPA